MSSWEFLSRSFMRILCLKFPFMGAAGCVIKLRSEAVYILRMCEMVCSIYKHIIVRGSHTELTRKILAPPGSIRPCFMRVLPFYKNYFYTIHKNIYIYYIILFILISRVQIFLCQKCFWSLKNKNLHSYRIYMRSIYAHCAVYTN